MSLPAAEQAVALDRSFFERPTVAVARDLLGVWLISATDEGVSAGPIVEAEAYGGPDDLASHARAGLTRRTTPMFGEAGHAYVYLVYGMHDCLNVVAYGAPAAAGAVLIRAIEPMVGVDLMRARRGRPSDADSRLCAGPARLTQALGVDRSMDGHDLTLGEDVWLAPPSAVGSAAPAFEIASGPRIGVDYAGEDWAARPWRFWIAGHASVSRQR